MDIKNGMRPVHPSEILGEEIEAAGVSEDALSKALDVPLSRVTLILEGRQGITADTALRLARYFGTSPQLRLNLQQTWELRALASSCVTVNALCSYSALESRTSAARHRRAAQELPSGCFHSETLRIPWPAKSTTARRVPMS